MNIRQSRLQSRKIYQEQREILHNTKRVNSPHQEDRKILIVYVPNNRTSDSMKPKLIELKGQIHRSIVQLETSVLLF